MSRNTTGDFDIPEKGWENPFAEGTPLHGKYEKVVRQERDLLIIVDDWNVRRGTGKTVASLQLAQGMDQTDEGITRDKVSTNPEEIRTAYATQPKRSALVLDEGEVEASNRQAMSKVNQALREIISMGRVEQKYVVINTPLKEFIDSDLQKLADVWISMTKKGEGFVHFFEWQSYAKKLLTPQQQWLEFEDIPTDHELRDVYNYLTREKRQKIRGEDGEGFIPVSEHEEKLRKVKKEMRKETRNDIVRNIMRHPEIQQTEISQRMVGEAIDVSQTTISNILHES